MSDETLKPCPFCGGEAEIERYTIKPYVACMKCGCSMPDRHQTAEQAIEAWNARAEQAIVATLGSDRHPYEQRITGDGSDWGEIMIDAYDELMAAASESCTPDELADLEAHILGR